MTRRAMAAALLLAACAPPPAAVPPATTGGEARAAFRRLNEARQRAGCAPLVWSDAAARVAEAHSADMAARGYFGHVSPDGRQPGERLAAAGVAWRRVAENIAHTPGGAAEAARLWLASPGHRGNILDCAYTHTGVGAASGRWTQIFYLPAAP